MIIFKSRALSRLVIFSLSICALLLSASVKGYAQKTIVLNSTFNPFTYDEIFRPMAEAQAVFDATMSAIRNAEVELYKIINDSGSDEILRSDLRQRIKEIISIRNDLISTGDIAAARNSMDLISSKVLQNISDYKTRLRTGIVNSSTCDSYTKNGNYSKFYSAKTSAIDIIDRASTSKTPSYSIFGKVEIGKTLEISPTWVNNVSFWESDSEKVKVTKKGKVKGISLGEAFIWAHMNNGDLKYLVVEVISNNN